MKFLQVAALMGAAQAVRITEPELADLADIAGPEEIEGMLAMCGIDKKDLPKIPKEELAQVMKKGGKRPPKGGKGPKDDGEGSGPEGSGPEGSGPEGSGPEGPPSDLEDLCPRPPKKEGGEGPKEELAERKRAKRAEKGKKKPAPKKEKKAEELPSDVDVDSEDLDALRKELCPPPKEGRQGTQGREG